MKATVMCLGTGDRLTEPMAVWREMGRVYKYAKPGEVRYYGNRPGDEKVSACDPRYGLVICEDFLIEELRPQVLPVEAAPHNIFDEKTMMGHAIAKGLANRWANPNVKYPNYGAVLLKGDTPTEDEISQGQAARKAYATHRLTEVKRNQVLRMQGKGRIKAGFDKSDIAWAKEYGYVLDIPLETMQKPPNTPETDADRIPCPECAELIKNNAKLCVHCKKKFNGKSALDFITSVELEKEAVSA